MTTQVKLETVSELKKSPDGPGITIELVTLGNDKVLVKFSESVELLGMTLNELMHVGIAFISMASVLKDQGQSTTPLN